MALSGSLQLSGASQFWCDVCEVAFPWKSRYDLMSAKHCQMTDLYLLRQPMSTTEGEEFEFSTIENAEESDDDDDNGSYGSLCPSPLLTSDDELECDDQEESMECSMELLQVPTSSDGFAPFPSQMFAMMYLIVHSPRPMGESNLKFLWYLIGQLHREIPSLNAVKNFVLPGYSSPQKYYTSTGIPFFVVLPSDIMKRCLGDPGIARMLRRYPVQPGTHLTEMYHGTRWWNDPRFQVPMTNSLCGNLFVRDFIKFRHPNLGPTCGKIIKFYGKEGSDNVYAEVEILLDVNQISIKYPRVLILYADPESLLKDSHYDIMVTDVLSLLSPPTIVLTLDSSSQILQQL